MDRDGNMSEAQNEAPNTQNSLNDFFSMMSPAVDNQGQMILGGQQEVFLLSITTPAPRT